MSADSILVLRNSDPASLPNVPVLVEADFRSRVLSSVAAGGRIAALFGVPLKGEGIRLYTVLARPEGATLSVFCMDVDDRYTSLTPECPQAHLFEREIAEQWGVRPEGHPWLKPVRYHRSDREGRDAWGRGAKEPLLPCVTDFFRVEGEEVHEVAVGPVHAGIIEPGHFRFQCHGENVFHLEIALGFQHRGVERALRGGPNKRSIPYMETLSGDTTIGHATAYCQAVEALSGQAVPDRAIALRAVALELERLANHTGDLGALANDVGYLPTASYCGRIRGDFLNMTALLCGNRFGRGMVRPGGVGFDLDAERRKELERRFEAAMREAAGAVGLMWNTSSVLARFDGTGTVSRETAADLGLVGMAARASGIERDVRREFPFGRFAASPIPVATWTTGDVFARAHVRWLDIVHSARYIRETLAALPAGPIRGGAGSSGREAASLAPDSICVSLTEGWRGEIVHVVLTDPDGRFAHYKVVDPSFHNWAGLALSLRNQAISDFPLCNKSFNLSYCGHDLSIKVLFERFRQGYRTIAYPAEPPALPDRLRGLPELDASKCPEGCSACADACPTDAIQIAAKGIKVDLGLCLFCPECETACPAGAIRFTQEYRLSARRREDLVLDPRSPHALAAALEEKTRRLFGRSLKLRQVSAGGCNGCEADVNVLNTLSFDLGRFGIQFVASPRHADGLLITGPISENMALAVRKTYEAVPEPRIVIATGACAISGGPYVGHPEVHNGAAAILPVDLYIPGCPPHPMTILDGLLRLIGRIEDLADPAATPKT